MKKLIATTAILALSVAAFADPQPLLEWEPNDTVADANFIDEMYYPYGGVAVDGDLAPGDIDFFSVDVGSGWLVTASVFDFTPAEPFDNDSLLGVFAPDGTLVDSDDDDGPGFLSSIHFFTDQPGTWTIAVTGFGDENFIGEHEEDFGYKLVLGINIPEPASLSLLLLGFAGVVRRR